MLIVIDETADMSRLLQIRLDDETNTGDTWKTRRAGDIVVWEGGYQRTCCFVLKARWLYEDMKTETVTIPVEFSSMFKDAMVAFAEVLAKGSRLSLELSTEDMWLTRVLSGTRFLNPTWAYVIVSEPGQCECCDDYCALHIIPEDCTSGVKIPVHTLEADPKDTLERLEKGWKEKVRCVIQHREYPEPMQSENWCICMKKTEFLLDVDRSRVAKVKELCKSEKCLRLTDFHLLTEFVEGN